MTRATQESLAHATGCLEQLAYQDSPAYHDLAMLLDLFTWIDTEIEAARNAAAYGSDIAEVHVLGSSSRGVEGRLYDPLLKELRGMRRSWCSRINGLVCELRDDGAKAANWPQRTQETG